MLTLDSETRRRLTGVNRLLEDIYGRPLLLSNMLRSSGLSETEIARLRHHHLNRCLAELTQRWDAWMGSILPSRRHYIVVRRYSFNGAPRPTLADLGKELGISRERVRQLQKSAVNRLRSARRRQSLENIALEVARAVLRLQD